MLEKNASEWLTWKEKSAFIIDDPSYDIEINIGTEYSGFYYILLHEMSHVYDYIQRVSPCEPNMETALKYTALRKLKQDHFEPGQYYFIKPLWLEYRRPVEKYSYAGREDVTFYGLYGGPKLKISEAPELYERLAQTPFVTLYGSLSWMEDWAEYMAAYMSINIYGQPWSLKVTHNGETVFETGSPFDRELVARRMEFVERLLED